MCFFQLVVFLIVPVQEKKIKKSHFFYPTGVWEAFSTKIMAFQSSRNIVKTTFLI